MGEVMVFARGYFFVWRGVRRISSRWLVQWGGFIYYLEWRRKIKEAGRRHMHVVVDRFLLFGEPGDL